MHKRLMGALIALVAAGGMAGLFADNVRADQVDVEFAYEGTGTTTATIFNGNTGFIDIPSIPVVLEIGQIKLGATVAVNLTNTIRPRADVTIVSPDGAIVEGETVPVTIKLVSKDGTVQEFVLDGGLDIIVRVGYDDDEDGLTCASVPEFGDTDPEGGDDDTCYEWDLADIVGLGTVNLFTNDMTAPYAPNPFSPPQASKTLVSIPICSLIFGLDVCSVDFDGTMDSKLEATAGPGGGPMAPVTDPGYHSQRSVVVGANAGPATQINFPNSNQIVDNLGIACGLAPGTSVSYKLSDNSYDARLTELTFGIDLFFRIDDPVPDFGPFTLFSVNVIPFFDHPLNVFASAPDFQKTLGTYQAETTPPTISSHSGAPNPGNEGSAITFSAAATDNCPGALTYRWDFSDGGVAFGTSTTHIFQDNGTYSYQLSVRDLRGNIGVANGSVVINNVTPDANAGPDAGGVWGAPIALNGSAVDPGAADQATLHYEWDFGDGTPSATGGPAVSHAFAAPGTYTATLTVCDKNGACDTDTASVVVGKRNTSLGYLGAHSGIHDTAANLSASLVDELGQTVNGRTVAFSIGADSAGSSTTSSSGIAQRTYVLTQSAGSPGVTATFTGDSLYEAAASSGAFSVATKATNVAYTGALTGGPNKTITLSAILKDAEGKPLAGRTIVFVLGTQTASAVTDANGIASTTLKLTQKNGTYTLTSTFTPAGGDIGKYVGSSTSATFKLQAK